MTAGHVKVATELTTGRGGVEGGEREVNWRWESPAMLEVSVFYPRSGNKNRFKLTVEPVTCL